jgi:AcrR family transcriptional regulator
MPTIAPPGPLHALAARKPRKQRATPAMILDAARQIARAEGWPAVTIRRVADALGYTSPLLYEHFRDKEDMLTAVLHEGFGALAADMATAAARPIDPADPDAYGLGVAASYLAFARREPAVYRLMNGMGGVPLDSGATMQGAALTCEVGVGAVHTWAAATGVRIPDALAATEVIWCVMHGVTCLALAGRLDVPGDAYADAMMNDAIGALLAGWRARYGAATPGHAG